MPTHTVAFLTCRQQHVSAFISSIKYIYESYLDRNNSKPHLNFSVK